MKKQLEKDQILNELLALNSFYETRNKINKSVQQIELKQAKGLTIVENEWPSYFENKKNEIKKTIPLAKLEIKDYGKELAIIPRKSNELLNEEYGLYSSLESILVTTKWMALLAFAFIILSVPLYFYSYVGFGIALFVGVVCFIIFALYYTRAKKANFKFLKAREKISYLSKQVDELKQKEKQQNVLIAQNKVQEEKLLQQNSNYKKLKAENETHEEEKRKKQDEYQKQLAASKASFLELGKRNDNGLNRFLKNNLITPIFYAENQDAVRKMLFLMMNKRANDITSLVNLYEDTEWKENMLDVLSDIEGSVNSLIKIKMKELQEISDASNDMFYAFYCGIESVNEEIDLLSQSIPSDCYKLPSII